MLPSDIPLLSLRHFSVVFQAFRQQYYAVRDVSLSVRSQSIVALVGESGCGKSLSALSILRLPPSNAHLMGNIFFEGRDILAMSEDEIRSIRGHQISMIFQEPQTALNPVLTVGSQVGEVLLSRTASSSVREQVEELFTQVGIPNASARYSSYPHELSGGMRQRVMIAMSLLANPKLLIADEPTTALDPTIRQQILLLLKNQSNARGMSILFISHDLDLVRSFVDYVGVMYAGRLVEFAQVNELFDHPLHPYTRGLLAASPSKYQIEKKRLATIPGSVPTLQSMPSGCPFAPRCARAVPLCHETFPDKSGDCDHTFFCWNAE